jgi:hypothetical protein
MNNHRIFKITTLPATDTKPARVKISDDRHKKTVILSFANLPGSLSPTLATAKSYLESKNIICGGFGELFQGDYSAGYIIFSSDFNTDIKTGLKN